MPLEGVRTAGPALSRIGFIILVHQDFIFHNINFLPLSRKTVITYNTLQEVWQEIWQGGLAA